MKIYMVSLLHRATITRSFGLYFCRRKFRYIFNHFCAVRAESYGSRWNNAKTTITPFKVIQGHRFWYQSKAHIRLPI